MENDKPIVLSQMARRMRVPVAWLRGEAEAGRIPHLRAGRQLLFNPNTVERLMLARAGETNGCSAAQTKKGGNP